MNDTNYYCSNAVAVVVTYNPDLEVLHHLLNILSSQVQNVVIVDNGSTNQMMSWEPRSEYDNIELYRMEQNLGIGAAQNIGIEAALKGNNIDFILLSDQDSEPSIDMVYQLRDTANKLMKSGKELAAVGPRYLDERQNNPPPFLRIERFQVKRQYESATGVVEVDYLIASGCLIPVNTLKEVGLMNEEIFIDYVDIEWGLRAQNKGFQSFGDFKAKMTHSLGDKPITFRGRHYPVHSPLRHYYMTRNAIWLYKQSYIPLKWKIVDGYRLLLRIGFYILFAKPRIKHFWMMMKGLFHGILSKMGPASV